MADEALRRADELLSELIEVIETARALPMSSSCVLPREHLLDMLDELREVMPPEMDAARTLIARRDSVLAEAHETATVSRDQAVRDADAVLSDAATRAEQLVTEATRKAADEIRAGRDEHARLVASTTVHQAAAQAAAALREDAERYQQQVAADAKQYEAKVCSDADRYAHRARTEAERYATKLTADSEDYAERTLDELSAVLHRAAQTAEQGRVALAQRRAGTFVAGDTGAAMPAAPRDATTDTAHEESAKSA